MCYCFFVEQNPFKGWEICFGYIFKELKKPYVFWIWFLDFLWAPLSPQEL